MLTAFLVRFQATPDRNITELDGYRMAAAWLELIGLYDASLSAQLHDDRAWPRRLKPYTVSAASWVPRNSTSPVSSQEARTAEFRLTLLDGTLVGPVISALTQTGAAFRPGRRPGPILGIDMDHRSARWAGTVTREYLWEGAPEDERTSLLIASPAAFRKTGEAGSSYVPGIVPDLLVGSLAKKWDAYIGLPWDNGLLGRLRRGLRVESAASLQRSTIVVRQRPFVGVTGIIDLRAPDRPTGRILQALLGFAFYAGVGMRTTHGMGQTLPLPAGTAASMSGTSGRPVSTR